MESSDQNVQHWRQAKIPILGMTCDNCTRALTEGLGEIVGVREVNVSLPEEQATILYDKNAQTDDGQPLFPIAFISKIEDRGFEVPEENGEHVGLSDTAFSERIISEEIRPFEIPENSESSVRDVTGVETSCCAAVALSDLTNFSESTSALTGGKVPPPSFNSTVPLMETNSTQTPPPALAPQTAEQRGMGTLTVLFGAFGAFASLETFKAATDQIQRGQEGTRDIEFLRAQLGHDLPGLEALDLFLKRQSSKSRYVRNFPGGMAAATSAALGIGGYEWQATPIGLSGAAIDSVAPMGQTTKLLYKEYEPNKKIVQSKLSTLSVDSEEGRQHTFNDQLEVTNEVISLTRKRGGSAALSFIGTAFLLPASTAVYETGIRNPKAVLGLALATLAGGLTGSILYSDAFAGAGWPREFSNRIRAYAEEIRSAKESNHSEHLENIKQRARQFFTIELKKEVEGKLKVSQEMRKFCENYTREIDRNTGYSTYYGNKAKETGAGFISQGLSFFSSPITLLGEIGKAASARREETHSLANEETKAYSVYDAIVSRLSPIDRLGKMFRSASEGLERAAHDSVIRAPRTDGSCPRTWCMKG